MDFGPINQMLGDLSRAAGLSGEDGGALTSQLRKLEDLREQVEGLTAHVRVLKASTQRDLQRLRALPSEVAVASDRFRDRCNEMRQAIVDGCDEVMAFANAVETQGMDGLDFSRGLSEGLSEQLGEQLDRLESGLQDASENVQETLRSVVAEQVTDKLAAAAEDITEAVDRPRKATEKFQKSVDETIGKHIEKVRNISEPLDKIKPVLDVLNSV